MKRGTRHSAQTRAKMSAASKAAWAEKYEADLAPKRKRESRKGIGHVPRDPFEDLLFGKRRDVPDA
jgi:type VI protein secretion system component VasK